MIECGWVCKGPGEGSRIEVELGILTKYGVDQVLRMRADMFRKYRLRHAERIHMDQDGSTSIEVSFTLRLSWATQGWVPIMVDVRDMFFDVDQLQRWGGLGAAGRTACRGQGNSCFGCGPSHVSRV